MIGGALSTLWDSTVGQQQSKDLMKYQFDLNQLAVENQNRYNSPIAQMERLREAGLNPNLVYGNGVDGNQSSAPNVGIANRSQHSDFGMNEVINNVFRRRQLENETKVADANEQSILANAKLSQARYLDVMQDVARKDATFEPYVKRAQLELDKLSSEIEVNHERRDNIRQQTNNLEIAANNLIAQGDYIRERTNLTKEQALTESVRRESIRHGIKLTDAQCAQIAAMIPYIQAGKRLRDIQGDVQELDFATSDDFNEWLKDHPNVELTGDAIEWFMNKIGFNSNPRNRSTKKRSTKRTKR